MEVTATGAILILSGMALFFLSHRWIAMLTVFFIPLTGTAVFNFHSGFWLQPFQFFGILWILGEMGRAILLGRIRLPPFRGLSLFFLFLFVGVVVSSMVMPFVIDGKIMIQSTQLLDYSSAPLRFTSRNLTTPMYILFGAIIASLIAARNSHREELMSTIRVHVLSGFFVSVWGLLQLSCYYFDVPYPFFVFNNAANITAHGFTQIVADLDTIQSTRISSVAAEPSVLAQYLLTVVPVLAYAAIRDQPIFSRRADRFFLLVMISVLLLSTSSSAYIGLMVAGMATFTALFLYRSINWKVITASLMIPAICLLFYYGFPVVREIVQVFVLSKLEEGSGLERLLTILYAWEYFKEYPILGVGWGSVTSFDLIVNLLSNAGILGLASFFLVLFYCTGRLIRSIRLNRRLADPGRPATTETLAVGMILSLVTLMLLQMVAGFWYGYGHFWFVLGMIIGICSLMNREIVLPGDSHSGEKPA